MGKIISKPITKKVPRTEQKVPRTEQEVPRTEQEVPRTEQNIRITRKINEVDRDSRNRIAQKIKQIQLKFI
jgi:hypothetical protein